MSSLWIFILIITCLSWLKREISLQTLKFIVTLEHGLDFSVVLLHIFVVIPHLLSVMMLGNAGALFQLAFIRRLEDSYGIFFVIQYLLAVYIFSACWFLTFYNYLLPFYVIVQGVSFLEKWSLFIIFCSDVWNIQHNYF